MSNPRLFASTPTERQRLYAEQQARVRAALDAPPRARTIDVPRRCAWCNAPVLLTPTGEYLDDRTSKSHRCKR